MRNRFATGLFGVLAALGGVTMFPALAGTLTPSVESALTSAAPDTLVPVIVLMDAFPDQAGLLQEVRRLDSKTRRERVVERMRVLAETSQRPVRAAIAGVEGEVEDVHVLWGINGVALRATPRVIESLANVAGIRRILHDHAVAHPDVDPRSSHSDGGGPSGGDTSGPNPEAIVNPDVVAMGAQQVWDELGYTGAGILVAVVDTGIDRTHPDLADHVWTNLGEVPGNGIDDDANGYVDDSWGWDFCLDSNDPSGGQHGTQVAGQVAGDGTAGRVTGMAPDAELMALGIDCDTPSKAFEASDYAIAQGAHVVTQSYSWWWSDQPDYEAFRRQGDTELAAGVMHVNSAGNDGTTPNRPLPYNISTPANLPAPFIHPDQTLVGGTSSTIAVGNIDWTTDLIAPSSSLGPSAWEDIRANTDPDYPHTMAPEYQDYPYENGAQMGLLKPDVSAYGNGTTSTCPGPYYCGFSGTSSAAPHVSGTVALMLQANPEATPAELAEILMTTAQHRGDPGKNNVYGTGLVQTYAAVSAIENGVIYRSHTLDDVAGGNGDLALDPGETVTVAIMVESRTEVAIDDLVVILSTATPGITIHDQYREYPPLPAGGTAESLAPHFTLTADPAACSTIAEFVVEMRYGGSVRRGTFSIRVGDVEPIALLSDDFETATGWTSDPGTTTQGAFVREDPIGVVDGVGQPSNPEDDTSEPGTVCWVTGNGELTGKKDENNNDVDGGAAMLLSPPFGVPNILSMSLAYDRWYYDNSSGGDQFRSEFSNDGGLNWIQIELVLNSTAGWGTHDVDLMALAPASDDMRLRFVALDGAEDTAVEAAVDEVHVDATWVHCQDHVPGPASPPNAVGDTLLLDADPAGHVVLTWDAPPVDGGHDAATLYRVLRAVTPAGPLVEVGSATATRWVDVDALGETAPFFYEIRAENSGGGE